MAAIAQIVALAASLVWGSGVAHPQDAPSFGVFVSDRPIGDEAHKLMAVGKPDKLIELAEAAGHVVWTNDRAFAIVDRNLLREGERKRHLEALEAVQSAGAGRAVAAGRLPQAMRDLIDREIGIVGAGDGWLTSAQESKFAFAASLHLEFEVEGKSVRVSLLAPVPKQVRDSLFASPPKRHEQPPQREQYGVYPTPWFFARSLHYTFNPQAQRPDGQALALRAFWEGWEEFEGGWSGRMQLAHQAAVRALSQGWALGQGSDAHAGARLDQLPPGLQAAVRGDFEANWAAYGFPDPGEAARFFETARVRQAETRCNLLFGSDPDGGRSLGVHILPG